MKRVKLYTVLAALLLLAVGCAEEDFFSNIPDKTPPVTDLNSVVSMVLEPNNNSLRLSIDAKAEERHNLWIDLNGDGVRADDGSEDIGEFNRYLTYSVAEGLNELKLYGDITYLGAASNRLSYVDVTGNPHLTTLNVPNNSLTELDISQNPNLERLDCSQNSLSSLDISNNHKLLTLWSFNNSLSSLDISNNKELTFLDCSGNKLSSLDLSANSELIRLICFNNNLTALDISNNQKLNRVWLYGNKFGESGLELFADALKETINGEVWLTIEALKQTTSSNIAEMLKNKGWNVVE